MSRPARRFLHVLGQRDDGGIGRLVEGLIGSRASGVGGEAPRSSNEMRAKRGRKSEAGHDVVHLLDFGSKADQFREMRRLGPGYDGFFVHGAVAPAILYLIVTRRPAILFQHGMPGSSGGRLHALKKRMWYKAAIRLLNGKFVCATDFAHEKARDAGYRIPSGKLAIVPFGIPVTRETTPLPGKPSIAEKGRITVGMAGRLVAQKRMDVVVESLRGYAGGLPVEVLIAGEGRDGESLRTLAGEVYRDSGGRVTIRFLGHLDDMADMTSFYDGLDLVLFPSRRESFGLVALEAMDRAVPVAVFEDVGGCLPLISHCNNGYIMKDGVAGLRELWRTLNEDPEWTDRMWANLVEMDMSRYDVKRTRERLEGLVGGATCDVRGAMCGGV